MLIEGIERQHLATYLAFLCLLLFHFLIVFRFHSAVIDLLRLHSALVTYCAAVSLAVEVEVGSRLQFTTSRASLLADILDHGCEAFRFLLLIAVEVGAADILLE